MNTRNRSRRLTLGLAFMLAVAGIVWMQRPNRPAESVQEPTVAAAVEQSSPTEQEVATPSGQVGPTPAAALRPVLWIAAGPVSGEILDPTSLATKVALIQGRQPAGRSALFTLQTPGALAALQRGPELSPKKQLSFAIFGF